MDDGAVLFTRHKLDVDDYFRMVEAGILQPKDRVELIDGEVIDMAPIGQDHAASVSGLAAVLFRVCEGKAYATVQNPLRIDGHNVPEPDVAVLRLRDDNYRTGTPPGPKDTLLVVEVSDSSLRLDREVKLPLYAAAGIPEFWIVDLKRRVLDAYREPSGNEYRSVTSYREGEQIALAMAPEIVVTLARVFE